MSLQDDIYNVEAALDGKPEQDALYRIMERLNRLERFSEQIIAQLKAVEAGEFWLQSIRRGDWKELIK